MATQLLNADAALVTIQSPEPYSLQNHSAATAGCPTSRCTGTITRPWRWFCRGLDEHR
jgi:hypothetical protein